MESELEAEWEGRRMWRVYSWVRRAERDSMVSVWEMSLW
jgi:hypothetical protein